jgi:predicted metal-dependent hydrolase
VRASRRWGAVGPAAPPRRLRVRTPSLEVPDDLPPAWHPYLPELAYAANSISLLMPYVEPYLARSVRAVLDDLDGPLREQTADYVRQELAHHVAHRRFNDVLAAGCPSLPRLERLIGRTYRWLGRSRSERFGVAFAAGSESIAFAIARWADQHVAVLFDDVDPGVSSLFLWHLAEEVEHKSAAYDVFEALDGSRLRLAGASLVSLVLLIGFSMAGIAVQLRGARRLWSPLAWLRVTRWSLSLAFTVLPTVAASCLPGHDPRTCADPVYLSQWLRSAGLTRAA